MAETRGRNNSRYVKDNRRLRDSLPPYCTWCGEYVDVTLPPSDRMSWTTDHVVELSMGGDLYGERELMHRRCNSEKHMQVTPRGIQTTEAW
jgi:hypothetical protein